MSETPAYVIEDHWRDPDPHPVFGRRLHPYGPDAHRERRGNIVVYFPNKATAEAHRGVRIGLAAPPRSVLK